MKTGIAWLRSLDKSIWWRIYSKGRRIVLGSQGNDGLIFKAVVYMLLISLGFIYLYPILFMITQSFKSLQDLLDPTVIWLPKTLYVDNFVKAWHVLEFPKAFGASLLNAVLPALAQMVSCALVGYGFARFSFPGKGLMFALMLLTFIVPVQVVMIPLFLLFQEYGMLGTPLPFVAPA